MNSNSGQQIDAAVTALRAGGVIAYPTEAVYGLGCDPADERAFRRLFDLKQRPPAQGVLLIAADVAQVERYIDAAALPDGAFERAAATWPGPHTWIFPRSPATPAWLAGAHAGIALRVSAHPVAAALCRAFGGAIVSTSANRHGEAPARDAAAVRSAFPAGLAYILDAPTGGLERPTPIRDAVSGDILRA
jgi:L-threonylcarbamoyladenylate synthase